MPLRQQLGLLWKKYRSDVPGSSTNDIVALGRRNETRPLSLMSTVQVNSGTSSCFLRLIEVGPEIGALDAAALQDGSRACAAIACGLAGFRRAYQRGAPCPLTRFEWFRMPVEKPKWLLNCRCRKHCCLNKGAFFRTLRWASEGAIMTTVQAICLGAMLAWTPSLVVLAWLLREAPVDEF